MKTFDCRTLVPGCDWHTRAEQEAEVVRRTVEHLRTTHGEHIIRPAMVENIKSRIRDRQAGQPGMRDEPQPQA